MVERHHRLNGREFEQALGDGEGQGSLVRFIKAKSWTWLGNNINNSSTRWDGIHVVTEVQKALWEDFPDGPAADYTLQCRGPRFHF